MDQLHQYRRYLATSQPNPYATSSSRSAVALSSRAVGLAGSAAVAAGQWDGREHGKESNADEQSQEALAPSAFGGRREPATAQARNVATQGQRLAVGASAAAPLQRHTEHLASCRPAINHQARSRRSVGRLPGGRPGWLLVGRD